MQTKGRTAIGLGAAAAVAVLFSLGLDAAAQDAKKAPPKTASACKGLDEKGCKGKTADCLWISPKTGKQKAYCRMKAVSKKKT